MLFAFHLPTGLNICDSLHCLENTCKAYKLANLLCSISIYNMYVQLT